MLFDDAKNKITPALISKYVTFAGGKTWNDKVSAYNPMRIDNNPDSFYINPDTGRWHEFSPKDGKSDGDIFDIISAVNGVTIEDAARSLSEFPVNKNLSSAIKNKKPPSIIPIPPDAMGGELQSHIKKNYFVDKYGKAVSAWKFSTANGVMYVQIRFIKNDQKTDLPFYYTTEKKWRAGRPPEIKLYPLYNTNKLTADIKKVIIVEGCKCATVKYNFNDSTLLMTAGACTDVDNRDWSPLINRPDIDIVIWPDRDLQKDKNGVLLDNDKQPGMSSALKIKNKYLPIAKILNVYEYNKGDLPSGWDIHDAIESCIDPTEFINSCPIVEKLKPTQPNKEPIRTPPQLKQPFKFLGYDQENYYFLPKEAPFPMRINKLKVTKGLCLSIAPLDYWLFNFENHTGNVNWDAVFDWVARSSNAAGVVNKKRIRSAGFWREGDQFFFNTGRDVYSDDGQRRGYFDLDTENIYIQSDIDASSVAIGAHATKKQGADLVKLFESQMFESKLDAWVLLGWSLMAPFSGLLEWRPPVWMIGPPGTGKSHIISNIIQPILNEFAFVCGSRTTWASLKRIAGSESRSVVVDEMEKRNKRSSLNIDDIIEMARDAASNASNQISHASGDRGIEKFWIRSSFLFASVMPSVSGEAMESRFLIPCLKRIPRGSDLMEQKKAATAEIMRTGLYLDPAIFIRRNFSNIAQIVKNIEILRRELMYVLSTQREADNYGTIFAFIYSLLYDGDVTGDFILQLGQMIEDGKKNQIQADDEVLLQEIISSKVRTDEGSDRTVGELLKNIIANAVIGESDRYNDLLSRNGICYSPKTKTVNIQYRSRSISKMIADTEYASNYGEVLRRHPESMDKGELKTCWYQSGAAKSIRFSVIFMEGLLNEK